jgi:hypothetical protein
MVTSMWSKTSRHDCHVRLIFCFGFPGSVQVFVNGLRWVPDIVEAHMPNRENKWRTLTRGDLTALKCIMASTRWPIEPILHADGTGGSS